MEMILNPGLTYAMSKSCMAYLLELHHLLIQCLLRPNQYRL